MGTATHPKRGEFRNEPYTDFSKPENRKAMEQALEKVKGELGREYPILIGGAGILAVNVCFDMVFRAIRQRSI